MGRVIEPVVYVFNNNEYDRRFLREELKKIRTYSLKTKEKQYIGMEGALGSFRPSINFVLPARYKIIPGVKPAVYAHELIHRLREAGLVGNDYVMANAISTYMRWFKDYDEESSKKLIKETSIIRKPDNLRPLTKKERSIGRLEYSPKLEFKETGDDIGGFAAGIERASKKTGSGLYFIKLVSDGYSPEKARDIVLGDYKPLKEFQEKYGRRWKRVLGM